MVATNRGDERREISVRAGDLCAVSLHYAGNRQSARLSADLNLELLMPAVPANASVRALPQFAQNFASWATLASQRGQLRVIGSTVIRIASYRRNG